MATIDPNVEWQRTTEALLREKERRIAADAAGRELARALRQMWIDEHGFPPEEGECDESTCVEADIALANPVVQTWLKENDDAEQQGMGGSGAVLPA